MNDFEIDLIEGSLNGLDTFNVTNIKFDWDDKKLIIDGIINQLELQSTCNITGDVANKTLNGKGSINAILGKQFIIILHLVII